MAIKKKGNETGIRRSFRLVMKESQTMTALHHDKKNNIKIIKFKKLNVKITAEQTNTYKFFDKCKANKPNNYSNTTLYINQT